MDDKNTSTSDPPSSENYIRIPNNTHPYYGSFSYPDDTFVPTDLNMSRVSSQMTELSRTQTFRTAVESMAESFSRASVMYMAENIIVNHHFHQQHYPSQEDDLQHYQQDFDTKSHHHTLPPSTSTLDLDSTFSEHMGESMYGLFPGLSRHTTVASLMSDYNASPISSSTCLRSTFLQSIFNAVNVLIGVGILALPLAFRLAGWVYGSVILLFCCLATNYTAKILIKCLEVQPGATTYGDIGAVAFGHRGRAFIGSVFIVELLTVGVAMVILLGDAIQSLFPLIPMIQTRIISFFLLTPTLFFPIRHLAYASFIGIVSCICLLLIVLYDGVEKEEAPGSLWYPAPTEMFPSSYYGLPISFGLIMSVYTGAAVFPSLYRDMDEPKKYNQVVNLSYLITTASYVLMAWAGYTMFGTSTMKEITQNLAVTEGFNRALNRTVLWLVFLTPIAKYGVMMNPLQVTWEHWLLSKPTIEKWSHTRMGKSLISWTSRLLLHAFIVYIAIIFPGFDKVMSLLGALFSFGISAIFPLACHLSLFGHSMTYSQYILDWLIMLIAISMAAIGTLWSFLPTSS
ncbi:transmembrane amino acid transporter protein-domain-containing protein [Halteromyces radiatus]|uniref:transmembrane amino acid transporter protein-domain-containing protein n=1 Tax=Halteromyces radiatus TaxID=101107 RepID=UPI00222117EA|nr:transmembrane amino acid transporter protein-domain-containing protein [Halteromyces radiatus]KAI8079960.1 transmembrane amino acid transporter protein-domain-containing protein [Halteromyces radiatus]